MKNLSLKTQILLITLVPILLVDLVFTWSHINTHIEQARASLQSQGKVMTQKIASASQLYQQPGNDDRIHLLLEQAVKQDNILLAAIYDQDGSKRAESRSTGFNSNDAMDYFYFRRALQSRAASTSDHTGLRIDSGDQSTDAGWVHLYLSRQQLQSTMREVIIDSALFSLGILIAAAALVIVISRSITGPMSRLVAQLKHAEGNHHGNSNHPGEANEIKLLQQGITRLSYALHAGQRDLNHRIDLATTQLSHTIDDLVESKQTLSQARDRAVSANRRKSEFLANMSHEIRTPINSIKGFMSLLTESELDISQQRYVDTIVESTTDLIDIINKILDFSKIESGKLDILEEKFDLHEAAEQVRDMLFVNALSKRIDLNLIIYSDTPRWVIGDRLKFKQILLNLASNAIKFTDKGGVAIRISRLDDNEDVARFQIVIEDSGIGISEEDQKSLFQAFSQIENGSHNPAAGTGLGLLISRNLATLMAGEISIESSPGTGSKFILELPFKWSRDNELEGLSEQEGPRALLLAASNHCMMESLCLFERAGVTMECQLVDPSNSIDAITGCIHRNLPYLDILIIDLRHMDIDLSRCLDSFVADRVRLVGVDYDQGPVLSDKLPPMEFISITNPAKTIARLLGIDIEKPTIVSTAKAQIPPRHVLLVDDDPTNLKMASELIRSWGHQVSEAQNGATALRLYQQRRFDYIILDIQMPDIDGVSLLQMIREQGPDDSTPIIALTANVLNDEAERLLQLGFDYFLDKPVNEDRFRAILDGESKRNSSEASTLQDHQLDQDSTLDFEQSLALAAGNGALLRQIFEILQRDIPDQIAQLETARLQRDNSRLTAIAHKLYGVTCYASLPRLKRRVVDIQRRLAINNPEAIDASVEALKLELAAAEQAVELHLEKMDSSLPSAQDSSTTMATT